MNRTILHFSLENEMDVVLAHKRAVQLGELTGLTTSDQTRFATAVSEIARNCVEYAKRGRISFSIQEKNKTYIICAKIQDKGPGIAQLEDHLNDKVRDASKRGVGIANSKKLVDIFDINSSSKGTNVIIGKEIPKNHPPINSIIVSGWEQHFKKKVPVSPYEEIKSRNIQLLEFMEQLSVKNMEADLQLKENQRLSSVLEQKNENLKQMAYLIAHDLKNPLNTITLSCEMYADEEEVEERQQFIDMINRSAHRMLDIIEGVQKNIEQDMPIAALINIKQIINDLIEQFSTHLSQVEGEIDTDLEVEEFYYPQVYVYSILTNFITNSIKYHDNRPLEVHIRTQRRENEICLTYTDNGIGIDLEQHKDDVFKANKRFTDRGEGKGLGLSIVKHLIAKNRGSISVDSEPGKGTVFTCCLKEYSPG